VADRPPLTLTAATLDDAPALMALRTTVADRLTRDHGRGHWSSPGTEAGVQRALQAPGVFVARDGADIVAALRLVTKRPWAIDPQYFTPVERPLYLLDMVVRPDRQRHGIGRACVADAVRLARAWPADAIRLDAYDTAAGAGPFYAKCGFRERGRVIYRGTPLVYFEMLLRESTPSRGRNAHQPP